MANIVKIVMQGMKTYLSVPQACSYDEGGLSMLVYLVDILPVLRQLLHLHQVAGPGGLTEVPSGPAISPD